jgi:hypothetical protein
MAKSKKQKRLPKDVQELSSDEVMRSIFGKKAQEALKSSSRPSDDEAQTDAPPTPTV